jgi:hypothetical protein
MPKLIGRSTIIEHKGLAKLKTFCANNIPFLVCRDETITDVGIDGEIELCLKNADGKTAASGERIKFQLKSTESDNSYIQDEDDYSFKFFASKDDIEYWSKHKQDVLLIICDVRNDKLYGKKITQNDFKTQSQKRIKWPVIFNKEDCILSENNFDFHKKYTLSIKERLNFDLKESASTNLFKIRKYPQIIYTYEIDFTNKENVYKSLPDRDITLPEFIIYNQVLYTFVDPKNQSGYFKQNIIKPVTEKIILYKNIAQDKNLRNHFIELIRIYFKKFLGSKGIYLNREHNRFYFGIKKGEASKSIFAKTRKRGMLTPKQVVKFYTYGKYQFYRHHAFEIEILHAENIYLCITPTYFITTDGKTPIDDKIASKFIIPQKNMEFNPKVADNVHTIYSYLAKANDDIIVTNSDSIEIEISSYIPLSLPYSIPIDDKGFPQYLRRQSDIKEEQSKLRLFNE